VSTTETDPPGGEAKTQALADDLAFSRVVACWIPWRWLSRVVSVLGVEKSSSVRRNIPSLFCRQPTRAELDTGTTAIGELRQYWMEHLQKQGLSENADLAALSAYCHTILNSPEFLYVD